MDEYSLLSAVSFTLPVHRLYLWPLTKPVYFQKEVGILWIQDREEWIATLLNTEFNHYPPLRSEPPPKSELRGPYALNEFCRKMLSVAYSLPTGRVKDVATTNPNELERLASEVED